MLLIHVQPDEGVSLAIGAKVPGAGMTIRTVHMDFLYGGAFRTGLPEAYERLILDAMLGDATLFTRADEVDEQWGLVDAIVAAWKRDRPNFPNYAGGDLGPAAADDLIHRDGRSWRRHDDGRLVAQVERRLAELRAHHGEGTRTSVMTHVAWAPPQWAAAARRTLAGLEELHPSRTILLFPDPSEADGIDVRRRTEVLHDRGSEREVCSEVIELRLGGKRTRVPGSIVQPLLITDLRRSAAGVGCRRGGSRSSSSSSTSATGSSSTRPSGAASRAPTPSSPRSSTGSPSRTSRGEESRVARPARVALARRQGRRRRFR